MTNDNDSLETSQLKERELTKIFDNINGEIALLTASAKFNFTIRKTDKKDLEIMLAYIEDTKKLVELLKTRMHLISEATS